MSGQSESPAPSPPPVEITVKPLGTIIVHGPVVVHDVDGNVIVPPPFKQPGVVKFCGCGRSGNKPFCDGSHKKGEGRREKEEGSGEK